MTALSLSIRYAGPRVGIAATMPQLRGTHEEVGFVKP
jgi:hypothetical protein